MHDATIVTEMDFFTKPNQREITPNMAAINEQHSKDKMSSQIIPKLIVSEHNGNSLSVPKKTVKMKPPHTIIEKAVYEKTINIFASNIFSLSIG